MKKPICSLLIGGLLCGLCACTGGGTAQGGPVGAEVLTIRESVVFWHGAAGDAALVYQQAAALYNQAQDMYEVEVHNAPEGQGLTQALAGDTAPDLILALSRDILRYQREGLLESLQPYVDNGALDASAFSSQALAANSADGELYALPLAAHTLQLYYNVDLLLAAGYTQPPETMEQLYEMALAATSLREDGHFEVLGYPLAPYAAAWQELVYAFGGHWWNPEDGQTLTPQAEGNLASLEMNHAYRSLYGADVVYEGLEAANAARYSDQDLFFQGRQLFRIDGSWLPTMLERFGGDVNWGVALTPGTQANPQQRGAGRYETDSLAIPAAAAGKAGAFQFAAWLCGEEGARMVCLGTASLPARPGLYSDEALLALPAFPLFIEALQLERGVLPPRTRHAEEYMDMVAAAMQEVYAGNMLPATALADLARKAARLEETGAE